MFNPFGFFSIGFNGIAVFATVFWVWVLVDCLTKEPSEGNDKVAWVLIILFAPLLARFSTTSSGDPSVLKP